MNYRTRFDELCQLFRLRYAAEKKKQISELLRPLTIDYCREGEDEDDQSYLDTVLERINTLMPMAKDRDRDEDSLKYFLKEAVYGMDWGMRATARLTEGYSYQ